MILESKILLNSVSRNKLKNFDKRYLDLDKVFPFFKLLELKDTEKNGLDFRIQTITILDRQNFIKEKLNINFIKNILSNDHDCEINIYLDYMRRNTITNSLNTNCNLLSYNNLIYSTYTIGKSIGSKIHFDCILCVKPEFIYYVKLCILTGAEIEYDCFYFIINKGLGKIGYSDSVINAIYKKNIMPLIKEYTIPVYEFDNINNEIYTKIKVPKFETIKEYNNWLDSIVEDFTKQII